MTLTIISEFDHANSGYELYQALKRHTSLKLNYIKLFGSTINISSIVYESDVLVFKGDSLPLVDKDRITLLSTKRRKIVKQLNNLQIKTHTKIILLAGGSGFRRLDNGNDSIAKQLWPLGSYIESCDYIFTISPDLNYPILNGTWLPHALDMVGIQNHWKNHRQLTISYYPNYGDKKGVEKYLLPAIALIKRDGYKVNLLPISGVSLEQSIRIKQSSTIYFENISEAGGYGKSGSEALSNGIPIICNISEQSISQALPIKYGDPILKANSIEGVYDILRGIVTKKLPLRDISKQSFEYAKMHSYENVSRLFMSILSTVNAKPKSLKPKLQKTQKIDIVIPYLKSTNSNLELVINSINKNARFEHRIIVIGDDPELSNVFHIPHQRRQKIASPKLRDSYDKLRVIVNEPNISETFVYAYDDVYWNKSIELEFLQKHIALNSPILNSHTKTASGWAAHLYRTIGFLHETGYSCWNYETHLPRAYNKTNLKGILNLPGTKDNMLIATMYFNIFKNGSMPILVTKPLKIKAGFYGTNSPYSYKDQGDVPGICDENMFINHNQAGLSDNLKNYLTDKYGQSVLCI